MKPCRCREALDTVVGAQHRRVHRRSPCYRSACWPRAASSWPPARSPTSSTSRSRPPRRSARSSSASRPATSSRWCTAMPPDRRWSRGLERRRARPRPGPGEPRQPGPRRARASRPRFVTEPHAVLPLRLSARADRDRHQLRLPRLVHRPRRLRPPVRVERDRHPGGQPRAWPSRSPTTSGRPAVARSGSSASTTACSRSSRSRDNVAHAQGITLTVTDRVGTSLTTTGAHGLVSLATDPRVRAARAGRTGLMRYAPAPARWQPRGQSSCLPTPRSRRPAGPSSPSVPEHVAFAGLVRLRDTVLAHHRVSRAHPARRCPADRALRAPSAGVRAQRPAPRPRAGPGARLDRRGLPLDRRPRRDHRVERPGRGAVRLVGGRGARP